MGAKAVLHASDILEELGIVPSFAKSSGGAVNLTAEEKKVFETIKETALHIDAIAEKTGYDIITLTALLTMMELDGKIRNLGRGLYGL